VKKSTKMAVAGYYVGVLLQQWWQQKKKNKSTKM
jgi:hypothetical protein